MAGNVNHVCVVSPTIYHLGRQGYGGIERLVTLFVKGLTEEGIAVTCVCPAGSRLPWGVRRVETGDAVYDFREPGLLPALKRVEWESMNCTLDFSHSKNVGRLCGPPGKHISPIWHDPIIMQPPVPGHNVVALSKWQADRFEITYQQGCRVFDPICIDVSPVASLPDMEYLLFIGKLDPSKGALAAIGIAKALKERLVIVGPVTPGDPPHYVEQVLALCDGKDIIYEGEVGDDYKNSLIAGAKALLYPVSYPAEYGEAHSHKAVEAMAYGTPCIIYDQGAMREIVEDGVTGFLISPNVTVESCGLALKACATLDRAKCKERALERWHYQAVVKRWIGLIEEVAEGAVW